MAMNYNFEWDFEKARNNFLKHKVTFEKAATVFKDPKAVSIFDIDHSQYEERWITLGITKNGTLIVTVHTFKEMDNENCRVRMISARKATKKEIKQYHGS